MLTYTIYKITDGQLTYVGMTVQPLKQRLNQHIMDAKTNGCSISKNLCQRKKPPDLKAFHFKLKANPTSFNISKIKSVTGTYEVAHKEELKVKTKLT